MHVIRYFLCTVVMPMSGRGFFKLEHWSFIFLYQSLIWQVLCQRSSVFPPTPHPSKGYRAAAPQKPNFSVILICNERSNHPCCRAGSRRYLEAVPLFYRVIPPNTWLTHFDPFHESWLSHKSSVRLKHIFLKNMVSVFWILKEKLRHVLSFKLLKTRLSSGIFYKCEVMDAHLLIKLRTLLHYSVSFPFCISSRMAVVEGVGNYIAYVVAREVNYGGASMRCLSSSTYFVRCS